METCRRCKRLISVVGSGSCLEQVAFRPLLFMRKRAFLRLNAWRTCKVRLLKAVSASCHRCCIFKKKRNRKY